ncbi:hypothetical protein M0R45_028223 [Rubus argutus]|uniref:Uncharacterized protein n=1 Tax=Rubus argutus TaxID=59490 RepID=A0AAW1W8J6_RUBAR
MAVTGAIRQCLQRSSSTEACIIGEDPEIKPKSAATEEVEDGIREVVSFPKTFSKFIASSMTYSTTRTKDTDFARKAKDLLQLLSLNIPESQSDESLILLDARNIKEHLVERQKVLKSSIKVDKMI